MHDDEDEDDVKDEDDLMSANTYAANRLQEPSTHLSQHDPLRYPRQPCVLAAVAAEIGRWGRQLGSEPRERRGTINRCWGHWQCHASRFWLCGDSMGIENINQQ